MKLILIASYIISIATTSVFAADAYTLEDCFSAAVKRSEQIGIQTELINQAEEIYNQAKASIFPTINGSTSYTIQQTPPSGTATGISPAEQTTVKIYGTQPLFRGFREYAAILQQNLNVTAAMSQKKQVAVVLYNDVVQNFYTILSLEQTLRNLQNEIEIDTKRIEDLHARVRIGRSKDSEILTIKTAVDTLYAQAEVTKGQLMAARNAFVFLTGLERGAILKETETLNLALDPLDKYLATIEDRPDVKAARDTLESVEKNVTIARAGHFPSIDLTGDYFFKRPGFLQDQHWDAQVLATVPIFAGGAINAQIRQAASQVRASDLTLNRTRRLADQEIRTDFDNFSADLAQVAKLEQATKTALENFRVQTRDYRLGLVTNLDVLSAIASSQQSQRSLDTAKFQAKLDYMKLQSATARRPNGGI